MNYISNITGFNLQLTDNATHLFSRGYTGHEHLDKFGLINMNGRLYDSKLARFLSPDPVLQDPSNTQNYNRYSYCLNNPFAFTDPSGYVYGGANSNYTPGGTTPYYNNPGLSNFKTYSFHSTYDNDFGETGMPDGGWSDEGTYVVSGATSGDYKKIIQETYLWGHWYSDGAPIYETRTKYESISSFGDDPSKRKSQKSDPTWQIISETLFGADLGVSYSELVLSQYNGKVFYYTTMTGANAKILTQNLSNALKKLGIATYLVSNGVDWARYLNGDPDVEKADLIFNSAVGAFCIITGVGAGTVIVISILSYGMQNGWFDPVVPGDKQPAGIFYPDALKVKINNNIQF